MGLLRTGSGQWLPYAEEEDDSDSLLSEPDESDESDDSEDPEDSEEPLAELSPPGPWSTVPGSRRGW